MKKCVIAIPIWKSVINGTELDSLVQCRCVLGNNVNYDIVFFGPERISEKYYSSLWKIFKVGDAEFPGIERFPDRCFESRLSYSHLLSSKEFYLRFSERYEHILVYQLDAWVFSDELEKWCGMDYDYIGAPWCHMCGILCNGNRMFVGNGGLSLRRISAMTEKLPYESFDDAMYNESLNEDVYISLCGDIRRPTCSVAARFSVETNASSLIERYGIPFGFHGLLSYDANLFINLTKKTFLGKEIVENGKNRK